jgi:hypothetical protein
MSDSKYASKVQSAEIISFSIAAEVFSEALVETMAFCCLGFAGVCSLAGSGGGEAAREDSIEARLVKARNSSALCWSDTAVGSEMLLLCSDLGATLLIMMAGAGVAVFIGMRLGPAPPKMLAPNNRILGSPEANSCFFTRVAAALSVLEWESDVGSEAGAGVGHDCVGVGAGHDCVGVGVGHDCDCVGVGVGVATGATMGAMVAAAAKKALVVALVAMEAMMEALIEVAGAEEDDGVDLLLY